MEHTVIVGISSRVAESYFQQFLWCIYCPVCAWLHISQLVCCTTLLTSDHVMHHVCDYEEMVHQGKKLCHGGRTKRGYIYNLHAYVEQRS